MASRVLLVEGKNDLHVMAALFQRHQLPDAFELKEAKDVDQLLQTVSVRLRTQSDLERLAVIVDADLDIDFRWRRLRSEVQRAVGQPLPETPHPTGTVVQLDEGRRFAAWLMPDNRLPGMLEDFVAFLIPKFDAMLPRVDAFLADIPAPERRFSMPHLAKARIHAWLAVQEEPGKPLGQAITARYLSAEHATVAVFLQWIRSALVA